jgi:hypothetical protein
MNNLSEKAMLAAFNISFWQARKYDVRVSKEVAAKYGTAEDAGRYNKKLLPADAPSYKAAVTAAGKARNTHYEMTLAWADDGARILPAAQYFKYQETMRGLQVEFDQLVTDFVVAYPDLREQARLTLNGLYKDSDYPQDIRSKFSFRFRFLPIATADDFRVALSDEDTEAIRRQIVTDTEDALSVAMGDLWKRLYDAVAHVTERLGDPDAIFRDSLIGNLRDVCKAVPALNLTGDPQLETLRLRVESKLAGFDPEAIRNSDPLRQSIAEKAAEIQRQMQAVMGR